MSNLVESRKSRIANNGNSNLKKSIKYLALSVVLFYGIGVPVTIISAARESSELQQTIRECEVPALKWVLQVIF
jgi:hypothetical protein